MTNMFLCSILKEVKPSEPIELKGDSGTDEVRRSRQKWGSVETNEAQDTERNAFFSRDLQI